MKLMMVCPTCKGKGEYNIYNYELKCFEDGECRTCHGKAVVEPTAQILDDLECAEIERELLKKYVKCCYTYSKNKTRNKHIVEFCEFVQSDYVFCMGETKLEAYIKAKDWMDGRGAE